MEQNQRECELWDKRKMEDVEKWIRSIKYCMSIEY